MEKCELISGKNTSIRGIFCTFCEGNDSKEQGCNSGTLLIRCAGRKKEKRRKNRFFISRNTKIEKKVIVFCEGNDMTMRGGCSGTLSVVLIEKI